MGVERFRVSRVIGDQQARRLGTGGLARCLQQTRGKRRVVGTQAGRRCHACRRDAPVARGHVVNGIVEPRRRHGPVGGRQSFQDQVAVVAVASRRGEDSREGGGIGLCLPYGFETRGHGELEGETNATPLGGWEGIGRRQPDGSDLDPRRPGQNRARIGPAGQPRAVQADTFDMNLQCGHAATFDSTRLQLLPPKPNELLKTCRMDFSTLSSA